MKVVQLLPELNEGGVERGTVELNREFVNRGLESVVISRGGKLVAQIERDGGTHIAFDVCSKNPLTVPGRVMRLRALLRQLEPDILHARSRVPAWLTWLANRSLKYPFVTTVHGLNRPNKYSEIMTKGDRVITVGEPVRDHILKHYRVDPEKVRVIQRGVDLDQFDPTKVDCAFIDEFRQKHHLENKFVVTSVGRITWLKDYETFIEAISLAQGEIPGIVGLIVGGAREDKQDYLGELQNLAGKLGVSDRIVFAGSQSKIAEIYALGDVLVNASLKMGNIGRTIVEAFALDTPVIATTYEGLDNLVEDGVNGYLIKTRDPQDLAEKIRLVHQGEFKNIREHLNPEYTLATMVERTLGVYEEVRRA
ncbi:glycosyltransferase family 4 protein [Geoalkalibacter halelectricus]|uniref:glycosyltransferase family 4 protein n=1 Tax=Geoalkalibacter halelectricus TaxID=2847045 RepID=UPI003D221F97